MADMKRTPREMKAEMKSVEVRDHYPLTLYLGSEEVEKLKLSGCKVGDEYMMHAMVRVSGMSTSEHEGGEKYENVTMEVRYAAMEKPKKEADAEAMYPSMKK